VTTPTTPPVPTGTPGDRSITGSAAIPAPRSAPHPRSPGAGVARAALATVTASRVKVELLTFFREKDQVVFTFLFPVILMLIFGTVFDEEIGGGVTFPQYFLAGMVASGLMLVSFQNLAIAIAVERDDGTLKRLMGTPMPRSAYFLGKIGLVLVTAVAQLVLLLATAVLVFDVDLPSGAQRWATFAWVGLLGVGAGTLLGIAYSSVPRSGKSASAVVTPVVLVLQFISGVFFVYQDLPPWLRSVAEVFPLKWMAQGMRSVFLPDSFQAQEVAGSWQHGTTALVLAVWAVGGLVLCLRTFRWLRRDEG
jgi:ABC-2 type transport system permease protein